MPHLIGQFTGEDSVLDQYCDRSLSKTNTSEDEPRNRSISASRTSSYYQTFSVWEGRHSPDRSHGIQQEFVKEVITAEIWSNRGGTFASQLEKLNRSFSSWILSS
jgi:hypothetical protein